MKSAKAARKQIKSAPNLRVVASNSGSKASNRGSVKGTHLKLVECFDAEESHEATVAKQQQEAADNEVVLDFSSNFASLKTCLGMVRNLNHMISQFEADNTIPEHVKAEKLQALYAALDKLELSTLSYLEAHLEEVEKSA